MFGVVVVDKDLVVHRRWILQIDWEGSLAEVVRIVVVGKVVGEKFEAVEDRKAVELVGVVV